MFPLRVRSYYSLLQGTASPGALCRRAKELGFTGLAMTDRDNLYGLWDFLKACKREGIRPIVGAEISDPVSGEIITCLVQNKSGYTHLCTLLTKRHMDKTFSLKDSLPPFSDGLLVLCRDRNLLEKYLGMGVQVVADIGAQPTAIGRSLRIFAKEHGIVAVATPDSDLRGKEDQQLHSLLRAVRKSSTISRVMQPGSGPHVNWLAGEEEYLRRCAIWPEVVEATEKQVWLVLPPKPGDGKIEEGEERLAATLSYMSCAFPQMG